MRLDRHERMLGLPQAGGTMAQFIIVTDAKGTKYRLNVNIDVRESVEAIDRLIGNTDGGSILSQ
jgi:hypothetical protein